MKRYDFYPLSDRGMVETDEGKFCIYADIKKQNNLYKKLKNWHAKALRMQAKMAEDIEPLYNKIDELEEQNKEMLEELKTVQSCGFFPDGIKVSGNAMDFIEYLIEKIEGEKNG